MRLVYEVVRKLPPARMHLFLTVELIAQSAGGFWVRTGVEGQVDEIKEPNFIPEIPEWAMRSWDSLCLSALSLAEQPLEPGKSYEIALPGELAQEMRDLGFVHQEKYARLAVSGNEVVVAGVRAVEATLTLFHSYKGDEGETKVWLALPRRPVLPYPVWVRPPAEAPWLSEIKLISFHLDPG